MTLSLWAEAQGLARGGRRKVLAWGGAFAAPGRNLPLPLPPEAGARAPVRGGDRHLLFLEMPNASELVG